MVVSVKEDALEAKRWYGRGVTKGAPYKQEVKGLKAGGVKPVGRIYPPKEQNIAYPSL